MSAARITGSTELARNALGLPQLLFCILTGSAPLAAMMFNDPLSGSGIGISVPAAFWMAGFSFMAFAVGYVEMAQRVTTAGGFYSYTTYGFGRVIGLGTAIGIVSAYLLFAVGVNGVTVYFANTSLQNLFGFSHGLADLRGHLHLPSVADHLLPRRDGCADSWHLLCSASW